jgi:hypothetical protein
MDVPPTWQALGYTGLFRTVTRLEPGTAQMWRDRAPCQLATPGWLLLEVLDDEHAELVRRDGAAIVDVCCTRREPVT